MRHHFHRCMHLRVVSVSAEELHGARRSGTVILEELCEARKLTPCLGLVECDVLTAGQKQELLAERATRIREEEGRPIQLSGVRKERSAELEELRGALARERAEIVERNLRLDAELGGAENRELAVPPGQTRELRAAGLTLHLDPARSELRLERLDELDRALDAMEDRAYGTCALCGREIEIERLSLWPETRVCGPCAKEAPAPAP